MPRLLSLAIAIAWLALAPLARAGGLVSGDAASTPSGKLKVLCAAYWDEELRRDPLQATYFGEHRYNDRLPDPSVAARTTLIARHRATRNATRALDPSALSADERIDREVLLFLLDDLLEGEPYRDFLIPLTQQEGLHLSFAQAVNFHPTGTVGDLENYLRRLRGFPAAIDATITTMKQGTAEGRVPPRVTMAQVVPQLRALATDQPQASPHWGIIARLPEDWSGERTRIAGEVRAAIVERVSPAYARLADFIEQTYLPACRETVGLSAAPDGAAHYRWRVRSFTSTDLSPEQIHEIGLSEIAKVRAAMDGIRKRVEFAGDLPAFHQSLRTDPKFRSRDAAEILARFRTILTDIDARLPLLFGTLPRTDYALREVEPYRAKSAAAGYYYPFPPDGSRPGYFYVNTSDPTSRTTFSMQALAYHEAVPGHHLQFALATEASARPAFRKNGYIQAFSEGWGLYSESLPAEVGLYTNPYAEYGRLEYNAWRCARLVVDTGMHAEGWSRDQAIAYLEENTAVPRIEIESEIDRYIAWPAQALAYKIGELKIRELRARAERRLGSRFDVRRFHDRLLAQGSIPLSVLERWMEADW
jgi:uncharacterized protein (DUF885 family)